MSFKQVKNPHIKKSVVTVAKGTPYPCPEPGAEVDVAVLGAVIAIYPLSTLHDMNPLPRQSYIGPQGLAHFSCMQNWDSALYKIDSVA